MLLIGNINKDRNLNPDLSTQFNVPSNEVIMQEINVTNENPILSDNNLFGEVIDLMMMAEFRALSLEQAKNEFDVNPYKMLEEIISENRVDPKSIYVKLKEILQGMNKLITESNVELKNAASKITEVINTILSKEPTQGTSYKKISNVYSYLTPMLDRTPVQTILLKELENIRRSIQESEWNEDQKAVLTSQVYDLEEIINNPKNCKYNFFIKQYFELLFVQIIVDMQGANFVYTLSNLIKENSSEFTTKDELIITLVAIAREIVKLEMITPTIKNNTLVALGGMVHGISDNKNEYMEDNYKKFKFLLPEKIINQNSVLRPLNEKLSKYLLEYTNFFSPEMIKLANLILFHSQPQNLIHIKVIDLYNWVTHYYAGHNKLNQLTLEFFGLAVKFPQNTFQYNDIHVARGLLSEIFGEVHKDPDINRLCKEIFLLISRIEKAYVQQAELTSLTTTFQNMNISKTNEKKEQITAKMLEIIDKTRDMNISSQGNFQTNTASFFKKAQPEQLEQTPQPEQPKQTPLPEQIDVETLKKIPDTEEYALLQAVLLSLPAEAEKYSSFTQLDKFLENNNIAPNDLNQCWQKVRADINELLASNKKDVKMRAEDFKNKLQQIMQPESIQTSKNEP